MNVYGAAESFDDSAAQLSAQVRLGGVYVKMVVVSKSYEKIEAFLLKQGSFEIVQSMDSITSNLDRLMSNIIQVDKFLILVTESMDFASEIRSLLTLLGSPSGLLRINEIVFFFKGDLNAQYIQQYIEVVADNIKSRVKDEPRWFAPHISSHELKALSFDLVYKALLGKSASTIIDPNSRLKYREERASESRKAFEPSTEMISISPFDNQNMRNHNALKDLLKKTENPASIAALETLIPEYDELKLTEYKELGYANNKWILLSGDRRSGSTTHTTALAVAAMRAGKSVLAVDFSTTADICEHLKIAAIPFYELEAKEMLDNSLVLIEEPIAVYTNNDREVLRTLLPYMQARPNVFDRDLILVLFDLSDFPLILGSVNQRLCSLILSSLMFPSAIQKILSLDVGSLKTLVWLNDNINSPLRRNKLSPDIIRARSKEAGKTYRFLEPLYFEDFEVESSFYTAISEVL